LLVDFTGNITVQVITLSLKFDFRRGRRR